MLSRLNDRLSGNALRSRIHAAWKSARTCATDLLFVSECLSCNAELPAGERRVPLCDDCLAELPVGDWLTCRRCAAEVPPYPGEIDTCPRCTTDKLRFDATISLGHYEGLLRDLILRMKTDWKEQWGRVFAHMIDDRYGPAIRQLGLDGIVPIPMTPWHRWMRGTNAPAVIARVIGQKYDLPVFGQLLQRTSALGPQRGLSRAGRFRNVRGGYRVRTGYHLDAPHILLVDDVMTTGATCIEAARLLKRKGAARVTVLVVARTPNT